MKQAVYTLDSQHSCLRWLLGLSALPEKHMQKRIPFQLPHSSAMILAVTPQIATCFHEKIIGKMGVKPLDSYNAS